MRYEYIDPFVESTKKVLAHVMRAEVTSGEVALLKGDGLQDEVSVMIAVKGDSEGCIIVGFGGDTARRICSAMNGGPCTGTPPLDRDVIEELSNMIAGNATSALNDLGYDFSVFPPAVAALPEILEKTSGVEIFRVPLATPCGEIGINVALKMN